MAWQDDPVVDNTTPQAPAVSDNTRRFLDFLAKAEGADYNVITGGGRFDDFSRHPGVVGMVTKQGPSTAAGRYQITRTTYNDVAPKLGIKDFSPESQDRIAIELIRRGGALQDVESGNYNAAIQKLGGTWASLPSSPYAGHPRRSTEWVNKAMMSLFPSAQAQSNPTSTQGTSMASTTKGGWMDDPVVEAPATTARSRGSWMDDPVVGTSDKATLPDIVVPSAAPKQRDQPKSTLRRIDDFVRGVADTATFGYADEIASRLDRLFGIDTANVGKSDVGLVINRSAPGTTEAQALAAQRERDKEGGGARLAGQFTGAVVPGAGFVGAIRAPATASRLARAGAGAGTGAIQGALYGSGTADGDVQDRVSNAVTGGALGAATGGILGGILPSSVRQEAGSLKKRAGTQENARLDAEIILDMSDVFQREVRQVGKNIRPAQAIDANAFETRYIEEAKRALAKLPKDKVPNLDDLVFEIQNRRSTPSTVVQQLEKSAPGRAVVDALMKADRVRTLTGQQGASGGAAGMLARTAVDAAPVAASAATGIPVYLGRGVQEGLRNRIGGSVPRAGVINRLLNDKQVEAARMVAGELGPSRATRSLSQLQSMAQSEVAKTAQQKAQQRATDIKTLADAALVRQSSGLRGSPLSGPYAETLRQTGLTNEQAVPILRQLRRDFGNTEIGKAAAQFLKSDPRVENSKAFYAVQDIMRDVSAGKIDTKQVGAAVKAAGKKGSEISRIVYGLPDDQVSALLGRQADTLGDAIESKKGYLVTRASRAFETAKKNPEMVPAEDRELLRALGVLK